VPRLAERAREIVEAQRSRGLNTEGGVRARIRGVLPVAGPLVLSALTEVEHRTMALEARAFAAPGKRTVLRAYPDSTAQRILRWALVLATIVLLGAAFSGALGWLP
jgi:energy-coupling factor transport system permease protein